jgi:hypothetical protein
MTEQEPIITVKPPDDCSKVERNRFRQMVLDEGEVQVAGLDNRIARAPILALLRVGGAIVGVGALKSPGQEYARGLFKSAQSKNAVREFRFELGWVVVENAHRRKYYARNIVEALVARADGQKIYATSVTTRIAMHKALTACSFERDGVEWQSKRRAEEKLFLFVHVGHSRKIL